MVQHSVVISGGSIADKHTHYEAYAHVGPDPVTLRITASIAEEFYKKYGVAITRVKSLRVTADFIRNGEKIEECQNPFLPPSRLMGSIGSLDDVCIEHR